MTTVGVQNPPRFEVREDSFNRCSQSGDGRIAFFVPFAEYPSLWFFRGVTSRVPWWPSSPIPPPEFRTISATGVLSNAFFSCVFPGSGSEVWIGSPSSRLINGVPNPLVPCFRLQSSVCAA